jgi:hypothetical protein
LDRNGCVAKTNAAGAFLRPVKKLIARENLFVGSFL